MAARVAPTEGAGGGTMSSANRGRGVDDGGPVPGPGGTRSPGSSIGAWTAAVGACANGAAGCGKATVGRLEGVSGGRAPGDSGIGEG